MERAIARSGARGTVGVAAAGAWLLLLAGACARTTPEAAPGENSVCTDGGCRVGVDSAADSGTPAASTLDSSTLDSGAPLPTMRDCPAGCSAVLGYPEDPGRGCVDRARLGFVGCDCNPSVALPRCGRRTDDDTLWAFRAGELGPEWRVTECSPEQTHRVRHSCEFAAVCAVPTSSTCSLEGSCGEDGSWCENVEYDAQGCRRPSCTTDTDCGSDQRCVQLGCVSEVWCMPERPGEPEEYCSCTGDAACATATACNPVATVGPGGAWRALELVAFDLECAQGMGCTGACPECNASWRVEATGAITVKPRGTTEPYLSMLSQADRTELAGLIDGPTLRAGLRDGFHCPGRIPNVEFELRLELSDVTLEQSVTECAYWTGYDPHAVARLFRLLRAY